MCSPTLRQLSPKVSPSLIMLTLPWFVKLSITTCDVDTTLLEVLVHCNSPAIMGFLFLFFSLCSLTLSLSLFPALTACPAVQS